MVKSEKWEKLPCGRDNPIGDCIAYCDNQISRCVGGKPIEITENEQLAIAHIVNYLWEDEKKDYECDDIPNPNHIFKYLKVLKRWRK